MAKDTTKKTLSPDLEEEVYQLWAVQDWSYEKISGWLGEKHEFTASREWVRRLITMGCGEACPVVPGARREDWPLPDPKGQPLERVRAIRDQILERVGGLVASGGWRDRAFQAAIERYRTS